MRRRSWGCGERAMVIGERFAWAHLPKAAGSTTDRMFRLFPELVQFADPQDGNDKHAPFPERAEMVRGRLLAMNLRRLPAWVISRANYVAKHGIWPDYEPIPIAPAQELAESSFPDSRIQIFTGEGRFEIDRWIRTERLAEDFLRFITEFITVDDERARAVVEIAPVNAEEYDRRTEAWFTPEQIHTLYERNPVWAGLEAEVYGNLHDPVRG
jgi:hypothetical protein